jgi:hypothetical protein
VKIQKKAGEKLMNPLTLNNPHNRFRLPGDKAMFNRIVVDMIEHGGKLAPSNHWNWNLGSADKEKLSGYSDEQFDEKYSELELMLNPWVGVTGMRPLNEESVTKYESYLRSIDHLGLLPADILSHGQANDWRETDLGSVLDVSLLSAFSPAQQRSHRLAVCEVGGGYGRLAEALVGILSDSMHYVLVDAVPGSLMYAYMYLKSQLPNHKVGSFYNGDPYSEEYDFYIMPAWQVQQLPASTFDICINVESMQEMEQHHVDHYLNLFDRLTVADGLIYISNARDYVFRGEWNIPSHWETRFLNNTPRSWSADHPTQILRKRIGDFSLERHVLEGVFKQQIAAWRNNQLINELNLHIADRDRICYELQQEIDRLNSESSNQAGQQPESSPIPPTDQISGESSKDE